MKVLLINGSPHANGNTAIALQEMERFLKRKPWRRKFSTSATKLSEAVSAAVNALP